MKIAIYEGGLEDAKSIKIMISQYMIVQKIDYEIDVYIKEKNIIANISKYDIVILGDKLEFKSNTEIGCILNDLSSKVFLVYYSDKIEVASDSYEAFGDGFIAKPIDKKRLFICFDRLSKKQHKNIISFKDIYGMNIKINVNDIISIISKGRYTLVCKNKKVWECNRSLKKWCTILSNSNFFLCKRGVLLNMHAIECIDVDEYVILKNGSKFKLTDNLGKIFEDEYNLYWS
ncbi:LytTR family transcriptional regulator DNA-binding domain-containing protein [Dielma fastidiosa]|uniref:DNA-binding LytR/AlgR family response regulator n=1 Tax=Dielma fastidiosa TaxID=1034346 RepID=A0A318KIR3_9FIRM|nr:LytTR family transcriptional regulator DNA-binding domain-containing protein [Dielma fastidiosa]PXX74501.1 DNA-binding LytR/AlgR family response regulator [Dielma fastidiosa]